MEIRNRNRKPGAADNRRWRPESPRHAAVRAADQVGEPWFDRVAARVRGARRAAGWSREKLANETNIIPVQRLVEKEYNVRPFSLIELRRIALVLGVPLEKFFEEREDDEDLWPVPAGDEEWFWRVTAPDEKHLLEAYRKMWGWQRRALLIMSQSMQIAWETGELKPDKSFTWTNPQQAAQVVIEGAKKLWPEGVPLPGPRIEDDEGDDEVCSTCGQRDSFNCSNAFHIRVPATDIEEEAAFLATLPPETASRIMSEEKRRRGWTVGQAVAKENRQTKLKKPKFHQPSHCMNGGRDGKLCPRCLPPDDKIELKSDQEDLEDYGVEDLGFEAGVDVERDE